MLINMDGPLKYFVEDHKKHQVLHGDHLTSKNIHDTLWKLKEGYSTVRPLEIVKAIGKEVVLYKDLG